MIVLWVGASDTSQEGNFTWDNGGRTISPGYTNWGQIYRTIQAVSKITFIIITFTLNDITCENFFGGICEDQPTYT